MLCRCQSLRWSGKGTSSGRQRLLHPTKHRNLSSTALGHPQSRKGPLRQKRILNSNTAILQSRSISLFGWGSSKPVLEDSSSPPSASSPVPGEPNTRDGFSVKASHATSEAPDPSSILDPIPPSSSEPQALHQLEERLALPSGFDEATHSDISSIPERIGYLKEVCGLDYGWGPSSMMQWAFEHFHIYTGCTWTTSIIATTLLLRFALIKYTIDAQKASAQMKAMQPIIAPLRAKYTEASQAGDKATALQVAQEIRAVSKEGNISLWNVFRPVLFQIPMSFSGFRVLRGACLLPVPAFESASFLWHTNLTLSDPFILPLTGAAMTFLTIRKNTSTSSQMPNQTFAQLMQYGLPVITLVFLHWQPLGVQIFISAQTAFSLVQAYILANPTVRGRLGIPTADPPSKGPTGPTHGMAMRPKIIDISARPVEPEPEQDVSVIDKAVDAVKAQWGTVVGQGKKRQEKKLGEKKNEIVEKYEYKRRQDLEEERERRNEEMRQQIERRKTWRDDQTEEVGGMRVRKKN